MVIFAATTGNAIAMGVGGIAAVLAVCAVFYAIGRGEDRDRAAAASAEPPPDPADERSAPPAAAEATPRRATRSRPRAPGSARRSRRP